MHKRKIGLALGSGAAKGWAHIGVINALNKMGVKFDVVVGCSAGALVGAAYACHKLTEFEEWVTSFKSWDVMRLTDLSWRRGGLFQGDRVFNVVADLLAIDDIKDCPIRFATVATNLTTGRELWLTQGNLRQAIRASCSMPGLFSPVRFEGYWLVDGAVVNPLPISVARALGADVVIAVDLQHDVGLQHYDLGDFSERETGNKMPKNWKMAWQQRWLSLTSRGKDTPPSAFQIMRASIELLENRAKNNRLANDPPDIIIQPYCPHISLMDFHRAEEAIMAGLLAVDTKKEEIKKQIFP